MMTKQERWEARRVTLRKYRISEKNKIVQKRYQKLHRKQLSATVLRWVDKNREHVKELRRLRYATPEGKAVRDAISKKYCEKNRNKRLAKDAVHNAVRAGKLIKSDRCQMCSGKAQEGHHPDYSKPLQVVWVCDKCHTKIHFGDR